MAAAQPERRSPYHGVEVDDPAATSREFEDTPYEDWWRQHVEDVHGFDPGKAGEGPFPVTIHSYEAG